MLKTRVKVSRMWSTLKSHASRGKLHDETSCFADDIARVHDNNMAANKPSCSVGPKLLALIIQ